MLSRTTSSSQFAASGFRLISIAAAPPARFPAQVSTRCASVLTAQGFSSSSPARVNVWPQAARSRLTRRAFAGVPMASAAPSLVSVDWLKQRLDDKNLRILDASWHMPNSNRDPKAEFREERIAGACFFDLDAVSDTVSDLPHMLPSAAAFAAAADALGIGNGTQVVLYDKAGIFSAPRVWWTFRAFGHEKVAVLDGGFPAWSAAGAPVDASPVVDDQLLAGGHAAASPPETTLFRAELNGALVRSAEQMVSNIESKAEAVVDARSPGRFEGTAPEPRPGIPSGHFPGSRNVPFAAVLAKDGRRDFGTHTAVTAPAFHEHARIAGLLEAQELARVFAEAGLDTDRPVVATCGTGVTASVLALALSQLPIPPPAVAVYDGSWTEWGSREDLPKAAGKAK